MHFLADENVPIPAVAMMRAAGIDIVAVVESWPGLSDVDVLEVARRDGRILLTFDRDFGEHVFRHRAGGQPGVVYCRFVPQSPTETAEVLLRVFREAGGSFDGHFTVIDRDHVRRRPLPPSVSD